HAELDALVIAPAVLERAPIVDAVRAQPRRARRHHAVATPVDAAPQRVEPIGQFELSESEPQLPAGLRTQVRLGFVARLVLEVRAERQAPVLARERALELRERREALADAPRLERHAELTAEPAGQPALVAELGTARMPE